MLSTISGQHTTVKNYDKTRDMCCLVVAHPRPCLGLARAGNGELMRETEASAPRRESGLRAVPIVLQVPELGAPRDGASEDANSQRLASADVFDPRTGA